MKGEKQKSEVRSQKTEEEEQKAAGSWLLTEGGMQMENRKAAMMRKTE